MRTLVVIAAEHYLRQLVTAGAFDALDPEQTFYVSSARTVPDVGELAQHPNYLGSVPEPPRRVAAYTRLRQMTLAQYRGRSWTMSEKVRLLPWHQRWRYKLQALPGVRRLCTQWYLRRTGRHHELARVIAYVRPDVVIAPSGGIDSLVLDAIREARRAGVPSLVVAHNWDNLSSKGAFPVQPDHLAVWGPQSVEHAERIHRMPPESVRSLGAPAFEPYFRHVPGSTDSPFPFRYALFAGCYAPFDELAALERLEEAIERQKLDVKVVYRPHPHRRPRRRPDRFIPERFRHVVLDPQVIEHYEASFSEYGRRAARRKPRFPSLDYYPALLEHSIAVVCPLSTMMVEAAIFGRPVLVVAYDDGIHPDSPATVVRYDHFQGVERVPGFTLATDAERFGDQFAELLRTPAPSAEEMREGISWWLYFDERSYAERLAKFAEVASAASS